ncbi:MAG: M24 family metallopeptidase [Gemmatimonadota bacterium]
MVEQSLAERSSGTATAARRERARARLASSGADALLVTALPNIRYLTGFSGSSGALLLGAAGPDELLTDFRYALQVETEVDPAVEVCIRPDPLLVVARDRLTLRGAGRVAFERAHLTVAAWEEWRSAEGPTLVGVEGWIEALRAVKGPDELAALRRAAAIADKAFEEILGHVRVGISERELAGQLALSLAAQGAERNAFEPVVAFGANSALPHARPGARALARGDTILLDFGAVIEGYCSDLSRTVAFGEPVASVREAYGLVLAAQRAALGGLRAGLTGRAADALARDVIEAAGQGDGFGHSLGHGIGLEVHEAPRLSRLSEDTLLSNMVVTVEPGVYIETIGGVRIEDDVVVGPDGVEVLTRARKDDMLIL